MKITLSSKVVVIILISVVLVIVALFIVLLMMFNNAKTVYDDVYDYATLDNLKIEAENQNLENINR